MAKDGVAMRSKDTRDLVSVGTTDYGELDRSVHNGKEVGDFGSGSPGVNFYAGVVLAPALHPSVQLVCGHVAGLPLRNSESENRCMTQLGLSDRLLDDGFVVR